MIVTISGVPGSGKTSVAYLLAEHLHVPYVSIGTIRGKMAMDRGITLDELNKLGETDQTTDTLADDEQKKIGERGEPCVVEGRLSWHFIPSSFKIFLTCDARTAAERIYLARQSQADRNDEILYTSIDEAQHWVEQRIASDIRRYASIYGVDYRDPSHYDLIIDTTHLSNAQQTLQAILQALPAGS